MPNIIAADKPKLKPAPSKSAEDDKSAAEDSDPFAVPAGDDSEVLSKFIQRLIKVAPASRSPESIRKHLTSLEAAFGEIMQRKVNEETFAQVADFRSQCLQVLADKLGDKAAEERLATLGEELGKDEREKVMVVAKQVKFQSRLLSVERISEQDRKDLIDQAAEKLHAKDLQQRDLQNAMALVQAFESKQLEPAAALALTEFAKALSDRDEPGLKQAVERLQSDARRLGLVGNTIEIKGKTIKGKNFDVADWKGKIVLVDFWATWCGPCREELPNVKKLYAKYHEKGFEVVGISLDDDQASLNEFLSSEKIGWTTLFDATSEEQGWNNPLARRYGISGIPSAILVDKEGKVITLNARGKALAEHLEKLLKE